jgi:hypothetical protein
MNKISRMRRSRDSWKSKATDRAEQLREFRKTKARQQSKDRASPSACQRTGGATFTGKKPTSQEAEVVSLREASQIRTVCVVLVLQAVVSFRAVPRILQLLWQMGHLSLQWVPHFTSVINWTLRLGWAALSEVAPRATPWLAIIDHSIDIGVKKARVVLRVPIEALARRGSAIQLEDCECIGLRVSEHTDGETVAGALTAIFGFAGEPVAISRTVAVIWARGWLDGSNARARSSSGTLKISAMSWPMSSKGSLRRRRPISASLHSSIRELHV